MNILIVDDDMLCVEGIKYSVQWEKLGIYQVFAAYSMEQAQKVFREQSIQIILCDVEMPRGSGLDLLKWVQREGYHPVSILLTSYATFQYAKEAISLGCMDYLTKPAGTEELLRVFRQAIQKVREDNEQKLNKELAGYWNENEKKRVHRFWREVLEEKITPDSNVIREQALREHLVFNEENRYLPILFQIHRAENEVSWTDCGEELQKKLQRLVFQEWDEVVQAYNADTLLVIVGCAGDFENCREEFRERSREYAAKCRKQPGVSISCYLGRFLESGDLAAQYQALLQAAGDNVTEKAGVYLIEDQRQETVYQRPPIEKWTGYFEKGMYEEMIQRLEQYLDTAVREGKMNRKILEQLYQDFLQAFYGAVDQKCVQAHLLFQDPESVNLYKKAARSVRDFKRWAVHMIQKAASYVKMAENANSVVHRVERYIEENLGEELNRTQLAEMVFLSPDYLTKVFRQEKGISLSEYITTRRMEEAERLLMKTDLPIGDIAYQVGYGNAAYFTKVFREKHQMTPAKFRSNPL